MKKNYIKFFVVFLFSMCISLVFSGCNEDNLNKISQDLTTYTLELDFNNQEKSLSGKERVEFVNSYDNTLKEICLHLYPNAFREDSNQKVVGILSETKAYPNGKSYGKIDINSVEINKQMSKFEIGGEDKNILIIPLETELFPEEKVQLDIDFKSYLPNINHRYGYGNDTINLGNFYPIVCAMTNGKYVTSPYVSNGDPFYSQMANYNVSITYDNNLKLANTGKVQTQITKNGKTKSDIKTQVVRDFAMVLSEKFSVLEGIYNNKQVFYYYFSDTKPEKSLQTSILSLKTFSEMFGEYPYDTFSVVEANFVHGGMEYPNLIYISNEVTDYSDYTNVIIHETAHQWWYGIVGNDEFEHSWLDEGLTEYSTALFYEKNLGYDRTYEGVISSANKSYQLFVSVYGEVFGEVDTSMNRNLSEWRTEPEYVYIAYVKGMLIFDTLREIIGEKNFMKSLKIYYNENKFAEVTPANLISAFEKGSNQDLENFFNSWIEGKVIIQTLS